MARIRVLRGGTTGTMPAPATFPAGEPWVNFPDRQWGVVDGAQAPLPLLAVRYFSALANYAIGDHVVQAGVLYRALVAVTAGPFNPVQWSAIGGGGPSFPEAPIDGQAYGRQGSVPTWLPVYTKAEADPLFVNVAGDLMTGDLEIGRVDPALFLSKTASGQAAAVYGRTGTTLRWGAAFGDAIAEAAGNVGSNFALSRYDNAGVLIDSPIRVARNTGVVDFTVPPTVAGVPIGGGGIYVSDTAPATPVANALWWDSNEGGLYLYYLDPGGAPAQWIEVNAPPPPPAVANSFLTWPAGVKADYFGATAPAGTRWCDGASYAETALPALFAVIGRTYGGTAPNFLVPDMRGRASAGRDDMGGTAANRLTTAGSGINGIALGAAGGNQSVTLALTQIPPHTHMGQTPPSNAYMYYEVVASNGNLAAAPGSTQRASATTANTSDGGGLAHPNAQPTFVCNVLITTGGVP
jgi:microcystin-dependent protein